ncbi:formylglycine-generating enzyme family protein, partial [Marinobacter koreensis]
FEPDKPAWTKNWQEPKDYCQWVGELADRPVDLPTEAQWEFAARNRGQNVLYATDNGKIEQGRNYVADEDRFHSKPVGSFPPNPLGLYDLMGNVTEWVNDFYSVDYYRKSPERNPMGPDYDDVHVVRGGTFIDAPEGNTTTFRGKHKPLQFYSELYGFRCRISSSITSTTLSDSEIDAIQTRVEDRYPDLSSSKQQQVTELVVRALDNMVFIEGGSFMMGEFKVPCEPGSDQLCMSDFDRDNDFAHKVVLDDYFLAKYETTISDFDLFREIQGKAPYKRMLRKREHRKDWFDPNKPAWTKSWQEPKDYCLWVGELAGRPFDLPTEAQWEYAARNRGQNVLYATDTGKIDLGENYPSDKLSSITRAVGTYPPNPLGLYDLMGNATEWVNDLYSEDYYHKSATNNPKGPLHGESHVVRGGSFINAPPANTSVFRRHQKTLEFYSNLVSFRCGINN